MPHGSKWKAYFFPSSATPSAAKCAGKSIKTYPTSNQPPSPKMNIDPSNYQIPAEILASNTLFRRDCLNSRQVSSPRNNTCFEFLPLYAPQLNPSKSQQAACALHLHLHWTEHKPVHPSGAHVAGTCNVSCSGSGSGMGMAMLMAMSMMMMMMIIIMMMMMMLAMRKKVMIIAMAIFKQAWCWFWWYGNRC